MGNPQVRRTGRAGGEIGGIGVDDRVGEAAGATLRSSCSSWYIGANIPGKPRVFMPYIGGFPAYIERCEAVVKNGYEGFSLSF